MKCSFCQERSEPLRPLKSAADVVSEVNKNILDDDLIEMTPYFEASNFKPNQMWLEDLLSYRELSKSSFLWRTESRVDSFQKKLIPLMAKTGLKVLDLGLESGSEHQLRNMEKSKNPSAYLNKASELIEEASKCNIDVKLNIMLYAGETSKTINETYNWLDKNRNHIKGVSIGHVIAYGWDENKIDFISSLISLGAKISTTDSDIGITSFHLSQEIDINCAKIIAKELSQEFMSQKDYYDLKSFSYFPRDYTYSDFITDIIAESGSYNFNII